jgi:hypothetical protein
VPITTDIVSSNLHQSEEYNIKRQSGIHDKQHTTLKTVSFTMEKEMKFMIDTATFANISSLVQWYGCIEKCISMSVIIKQMWSWSCGSWIYNYLYNQCLSPLILWVRISIRARSTTLCDKLCQWLATGFLYQ